MAAVVTLIVDRAMVAKVRCGLVMLETKRTETASNNPTKVPQPVAAPRKQN
jgi:hypothetical protein